MTHLDIKTQKRQTANRGRALDVGRGVCIGLGLITLMLLGAALASIAIGPSKAIARPASRTSYAEACTNFAAEVEAMRFAGGLSPQRHAEAKRRALHWLAVMEEQGP